MPAATAEVAHATLSLPPFDRIAAWAGHDDSCGRASSSAGEITRMTPYAAGRSASNLPTNQLRGDFDRRPANDPPAVTLKSASITAGSSRAI